MDSGLPEIKVAVNVSAHQFRAGDLDVVLARALAEHGVAPYCLEVELTDQRMPQMTGTELLHRLCVIAPDTVRMVLSGYTDLDTIAQAVNEGDIFMFMTKPWDDDQLRANIRDAFTYSEAVRARNKLVAAQVGEPV